ncbi:tol-pal system YbgF family protein [Colwelliaceae bacterium BS250]
MVNSVVQHSVKQHSVKQVMKKYKKAIISVLVILSAASIYDNPQGFLNLWMTRDQQGAMFLKQGNVERAAITFEEKHWSAYSFYQAGNFEQALSLFKKQQGDEALFAQANALAHLGQIFKAQELYQALLKTNSAHQGAAKNLKLMEEIIKNFKKSKKKVVELTEDGKMNNNANQSDAPKVESQIPTNQLWLKQVQQNPSKFLRKKFQQEHVNANK